MKYRLLVGMSLIVLIFSTLAARAQPDFDSGYRFIFYAALEGCYEDGLATNDISQILLRDEKATNLYLTSSMPASTVAIGTTQSRRH